MFGKSQSAFTLSAETGNLERVEAKRGSPEGELVGLLAEAVAGRQLDDLAEEDVDDGVAKLLEEQADLLAAEAEGARDLFVLVLGGQQRQRHGHALLQRHGALARQRLAQRLAQVAERALAHVELLLELRLGEARHLALPVPEPVQCQSR